MNPSMSSTLIDLLSKMICLNPNERISAKDALNHSFFYEDPLPCNPNQIPLNH